jgi:uncharacterized membrane-anchored protein
MEAWPTMRLPTLRRQESDLAGITGRVRLDRRTSNLGTRLRPGEIAVIEHVDLDRASAEALLGAQAAVVINAAPSISGRYPNLGPQLLAQAGVPLIDDVGPAVFQRLEDGDSVRVDAGVIYRGDTEVAAGRVLDTVSVAAAMDAARAGLPAQLDAFSVNSMEYLRREHALLLDGAGVPHLDVSMEGRQVVVVVRGYDYRRQLGLLRPYIRERRPVLLGVDQGADALLQAGYQPDLIVGDLQDVSDQALRSGAEVVLRGQRDDQPIGTDRLERLGVRFVPFAATGTSEDAALLLADSRGASLIISVGSHATLVELLDAGRAEMASTFLTRLRVGPKLIDAKGVAELYQPRIRAWQLVLLVLAGLIALLVAVGVTPLGRSLLHDVAVQAQRVAAVLGPPT